MFLIVKRFLEIELALNLEIIFIQHDKTNER